MQTNVNHEKIVDVLKIRGPSLPIQIATAVGLSSLFVSAFLSELAHEKRVKISHLKVGGSPVYFLDGQEEQLEKFYTYMHPKEAEAFLLLKERKLLRDSDQKPAIRVALRSIRDFAVGFKVDEEIFWRYAFTPESDIIELIEPKKPKQKEPKKEEQEIVIQVEPKKEETREKIKEDEKAEEEVEVVEVIKIKEIEAKQKEIAKDKAQNSFLEEVKSYLSQKNIELVNLEYHDKKEVMAKVRFSLTPEKIHLLLAYNKKKINDKDLLKAYKTSLKHQLDYFVLFKGELSKKLKDTIEAYKSLVSTDKI